VDKQDRASHDNKVRAEQAGVPRSVEALTLPSRPRTMGEFVVRNTAVRGQQSVVQVPRGPDP